MAILNVKSLREQVYEFIRDEIEAGNIRPDTTLNLNRISEHLGISKTPLRDALIKLEVEGFVTILPRRGVVVNGLTLEDVRDFYQIIGALEGAVVKEVFDRLDNSHVSAMRRLTADMRQALHREEFERYYQINIHFHDVFLDMSASNTLRPMIMPMKQRLYDFQRRPYMLDWEFHNCDEHDQFVERIEQGDCQGAVHILREVHWSFHAQQNYIRKFYDVQKPVSLPVGGTAWDSRQSRK